MKYISLFSGVEAATLAWSELGWEAVAFAEIEPFPSAVLAERWPDVPNLGDVTKVDWRPYRGAVDVVVGGSPCQAFSVAGKRRGLMDERGLLMLEYVRAVAEIAPRWFLWENVPGVLSQDRGRAFGTLLREMDELGYGMAWRVLDAQFFGVAQRRRRVFLVGCLGAGGGASAVLFEPEGVFGDTPSSKEKRQALAADARSRAAGSGGGVTAFAQNQRDEVRLMGGDGTVSGALSAQQFGSHKQETLVMASAHTNAEIGEGGVAPSLMAHAEKQPPILATVTTCSRACAPLTGTSSSSTTNPSTAGGSCSTPDGGGPSDVTVIDRAAFNQGANASYPPPHRADGADGHARGEGPARGRVLASNGEDVVGALCARDYKGVGSQYVHEGKVVLDLAGGGAP